MPVRAAHASRQFLLRALEVIAMMENRLSALGVEDTITAPGTGELGQVVPPAENHTSNDKPSPSPNGPNRGQAPFSAADPAADAKEPAAGPATAGRGQGGRFAKGNPGGPGNPFARQVAALREAALAAITPEDVHAILAKMAELALAGDVQAAKLVLAYAVGKPAATADPDRLDVEEWKHFKETAPMMNEAETLLTPEPRVLLPGIRWGRQAKTWEFADGLTAVLRSPEQELPSLVGRAGRVSKNKDKRRDNGARPTVSSA
jgi:hypothetical protein